VLVVRMGDGRRKRGTVGVQVTANGYPVYGGSRGGPRVGPVGSAGGCGGHGVQGAGAEHAGRLASWGYPPPPRLPAGLTRGPLSSTRCCGGSRIGPQAVILVSLPQRHRWNGTFRRWRI